MSAGALGPSGTTMIFCPGVDWNNDIKLNAYAKVARLGYVLLLYYNSSSYYILISHVYNSNSIVAEWQGYVVEDVFIELYYVK